MLRLRWLEQRLIWPLALLLALGASIYLIRGVAVALSDRGSYDLGTRAMEYRLFADGVYPHNAVASNALPGEILPGSVYPPYAFPMFSPFFFTGVPLATGIAFGGLTLAALFVVGVFGFRELRRHGWRAGAFGAVTGLAIAHNSTAVGFGQFSIISMGLVTLQLLCLQRGQVLLAGAAWALAMIKPQIAIAFALLFMTQRRWRGLAFGGAILLALSWLTLVHTRVSVLTLVEYWFSHEDFSFLAEAETPVSGSGGMLAAWGVSPRNAVWISLLAAATMAAGAWWRVERDPKHLAILVGVCAIIGRVFIPHRAYDNIMLFPALLALLGLALDRKSARTYAIAAIFGISVWLPMTSLFHSVWLDATLMLFWLGAGFFLMHENASTRAPG